MTLAGSRPCVNTWSDRTICLRAGTRSMAERPSELLGVASHGAMKDRLVLVTAKFIAAAMDRGLLSIRCRRYISLPFAESSIFCFGCNTPLGSQMLFSIVVE
ncbi:hypothetical protein B296_00043576 [Ensete ventricosum]|uniref:Uncharacterized protein n=1 Tax=Ensete ventricosum TaxID=4639 RepID=A0A426YUH5_ENSVE|nr:hypothetical protein B296_00043576 [Ensete ventricosum]